MTKKEEKNVSEKLQEKFERNKHWTEEFRKGYSNGYQSATSTWQTKLKNSLKEKERERVDLCRVYPYNLLPIIYQEDEREYLDDDDDSELPKYDVSIRAMRKTMLENLTERENRVLEMRYSWNLTLEECGKELGVARERVRQIEAKAFRKLRNTRNIKKMQCVPLTDYIDLEIKNRDLESENEELRERLRKIENFGNDFNLQKISEDPKKLLNTKIENMDFSIRTYNCLKRYGINTIGDLTSKDWKELTHIRNLGRKSAIEINQKISSIGLEIKGEPEYMF